MWSPVALLLGVAAVVLAMYLDPTGLIIDTIVQPDNIPSLKTTTTTPTTSTTTTTTTQTNMEPVHVIVVGGGLAGLSASIEAARHGARVTLIEKQPRLTGNSAKASSGINAVNTDTQTNQESKDTVQAFKQDTVASGKGFADPTKVSVLAQTSADAIKFLVDAGANLELLSQCGGHSQARTHRNKVAEGERPVNVGYHLVSTLTNVLKGELKDQVNIITQGHVTELLQSTTDRVIGVLVDVTDEHGSVTSEEVVGDAVILATGGFAADRNGLLTEFKPEYVNIPTTNGAFAQGEGIKLARAVGAGLQHMEFIQLHPTGIVNPSTYETAAELSKLLAPEALRGLGGLLLTREGKRFTNEVGYRDDVTQAIFDQKNQFKPLHTAAEVEVEVEVTEEDEGKDAPLIVAYLVINDAIETAFGKAVMGFYRSRGIVHTVDNAAGLATLLGAEVETLTNTFNSYNALVTSAAEADTVDAFGKTRFPEPFSPEERLHLIVITPVIHYCMGGLETNLMGVVQNAGGGNINGLFAAGEVSAGLHGANRLAGNSLSECVVFGRLAGLMATRI